MAGEISETSHVRPKLAQKMSRMSGRLSLRIPILAVRANRLGDERGCGRPWNRSEPESTAKTQRPRRDRPGVGANDSRVSMANYTHRSSCLTPIS